MKQSGKAAKAFTDDQLAQELFLLELHDPKPSDPSRPCLAKLGTDILTMVFDLVQQSSKDTIHSVALVSSYFYSLARYSQCRNIVISRSGENDDGARQLLLKLDKQNLLPAVRRLSVPSGSNLGDYAASTLSRLLPRMTGLRDFHWDHGVTPQSIIEALTKCSGVRLHTEVTYSGYDRVDLNKTNLVRLAGNHNLYSLTVQAEYTEAEDCKAVTQPLKRLLLSCPNLRKLKLDISLPTSGCCVYEEPQEYCGFGFVHGQRPPALEDLVLRSYPFGRNALQDGCPYDALEEDYWAEHFDWSNMRKLNVQNHFAIRIMHKLTALKEIVFERGWDYGIDIARLLMGLPVSLESIALQSASETRFDTVMRHAGTLRRLQLHQLEYHSVEWSKEAVSAEQLRRLRDECPLLEELAIDVARDGTWPYEVLDVLGDFPRLRSLEVWFALGNSSSPTEPKVTFGAAAMLFNLVRKQSSRAQRRLEKVTFHSGAPAPIGLGYPSDDAFWPESNNMSFVCTVAERDDERAQGRFYVSCPPLTARDDSVIAEVNPAGQDCQVSSHLRLALAGPIPYGEPGSCDIGMGYGLFD